MGSGALPYEWRESFDPVAVTVDGKKKKRYIVDQ
jgi:hypothetical protein